MLEAGHQVHGQPQVAAIMVPDEGWSVIGLSLWSISNDRPGSQFRIGGCRAVANTPQTPPQPSWAAKPSLRGPFPFEIGFSTRAGDGGLLPHQPATFGRSFTLTSPSWLVNERVWSLLWACATPKIR